MIVAVDDHEGVGGGEPFHREYGVGGSQRSVLHHMVHGKPDGAG